MKDLKKLSGIISAAISVIVIRYIIQKIGIENIPVKLQMIILLISPILVSVGIYKFSANKDISKHLVVTIIVFTIVVISVAILMIIKETNYQYFEAIRIPIVLFIFVLLIVMLVVLIIGLGEHQKK